MMNYVSAETLADAVRLQKETGYAFLAGGTDVYPALEHGWRPKGLLDISRLPELSGGIRAQGGWWVIPAMTTWAQVAQAQLPPQFDGLRAAAAEVGGRQIQNQGTVAGNICNASPAADGVTALIGLDARVVVAGAAGEHEVPLQEFVLGNRRTAARSGELVTSVKVPAASGPHGSSFSKHGSRRYLVISLVMTAAFIEADALGRVARCCIAVGACAPRSLRLVAAEARLTGMSLGQAAAFSLAGAELDVLTPIDDVRATAAFRRRMARELVERDIRSIALQLQSDRH
ncbi:FAD binding domain-containing protein [Ramlibacter tataouinensis]|uniref:FAD binding domain-containing protein n=1 Tax=Ramlibacter tataouinensis TaxID=94132 RepID=UPI0022F3FDDB|nr:FAD binding domain-containing protein [Ramlibacter tataouinensis]WBY00558.1 FAD binding domain-containing protein [Ramlibacter tataouinensis]